MTGTFNGFEPANTTPVPDILFDQLLSELSGSELKVLLYIIRRTSGFKKETDAISLSQFTDGIITREGKVLDHGCGIKNRTLVSKALAKLEKLGCIQSRKTDDPTGDKATTVYSIRFRGSTKSVLPAEEGSNKSVPPSIESVPPVVSKTYHRSNESVPGVVRKLHPQETVLQDTDKQETVIQEDSFGDFATATPPSPSDDFAEDITDTPTEHLQAIKKGQTDEHDNHHSMSSQHSNHAVLHPLGAPDDTHRVTPPQRQGTPVEQISTPDVDNSQAVGDTSVQQQMLVAPGASKQSAGRGKKASEGEPEVEDTAPSKPLEPKATVKWGTRKCLAWFDYWRGGILIGKYKLMQASTCAKGLAEQFDEATVIQVRNRMAEDPYYIARGGVDVCDVANNIHRELKKIQQKPQPSPASGKVTPLFARNLSEEMAAMRAQYAPVGAGGD